MTEYLYWCGAVLNVAVLLMLLLVVWVWFIWPAVETISMVRYYRAVSKRYPDVKLKSPLRLFISCYEPFGRQFEGVRCNYGRWEGVGKWEVYSE